MAVYWKRAYDEQAAIVLRLRDQILGLEAELVTLRRENQRLLQMFKQLAKETSNAQVTSSPPPNDRERADR